MPALLMIPTAFAVVSESDPDRTYDVTLHPCECCARCTCPDYVYRHKGSMQYVCKHIDAARAWTPDATRHLVALASALREALDRAARSDAAPPRRARRVRPCSCACNGGGACGGCGHAGCGGR
ncbi:hypothetical protein ACFHW2_11955 [Actinomadura sp. LOL_016]|uniref:hypothetical protein n=1 Tax=unclassified Actinomadura TaxID=2626254 RepID=UPI003A8098B4